MASLASAADTEDEAVGGELWSGNHTIGVSTPSDTVSHAGSTNVGDGATLTIQNGWKLDTAVGGNIGGVHSRVTVNGPATTWAVGGGLQLNGTDSLLRIENGGTVTVGLQLLLGTAPSSRRDTVIVTGTGSTLTANANQGTPPLSCDYPQTNRIKT